MRLIATSKSGYYKRHRSNFVVFNAQVSSLGGRVLKQADLDLTLDGEKLTQAARAAGENFYVLYENDPSPFWKPGSIPMSRVLRDAVWWTRIHREDEDLFLPMNSGPWRESGGDCATAWAVGKTNRPTLWTCGTTRPGGAVATCPERSFRCWDTRPGVSGRRGKMRFSRLKSPKPGVALCVMFFITASDCWTMFGSVTAPPSRRSCMTTPSACWIR